MRRYCFDLFFSVHVWMGYGPCPFPNFLKVLIAGGTANSGGWTLRFTSRHMEFSYISFVIRPFSAKFNIEITGNCFIDFPY